MDPKQILEKILLDLADGEDPSSDIRYMAPTFDHMPGVAFFEVHLNSPSGKLEERLGVTICVGRIK
jgi:hypothetical protein